MMNLKIRNRLSTSVLTSLVMVGFAGCSSEPKVLPPTQHLPIDAALVGIYQTQPKEYELLGPIAVTVTPEMKWDERGDSTAGFDALKSKAAAMGANGVLLLCEPGSYDRLVMAGYKGDYYPVAMKGALGQTQTAVARAIFVVKAK